MSSSCFKFPGRGLQGGGAAGRLGCGLLFTRALCGMQLSRLEAPTIASSWAVSQPKELGGGTREEHRRIRGPFLPSVLSAFLGGCSYWYIRPGWASSDINVSINWNPSGLDVPELYGLYALNLSFPFPCFISLLTSPLSREELLCSPPPRRLHGPFVRRYLCVQLSWLPCLRLGPHHSFPLLR